MEVQRYPDDFDGVVAGSSVAMPAATAASWWKPSMEAIPRRTRNFHPASPYPLLHTEVLKACDGLDGIPDAQIDDPRRCRFDPAVLG